MPLILQPSHLDQSSHGPVALQVVRLLVGEIQAGRLRPGEALPGSRLLSEQLDITRHAAMSALRELELEGWVESRPASGTFVAAVLPAEVPAHWGTPTLPPAMPEAPAFQLPDLAPVSSVAMGMTDLSEGFPDARLAPKEALARGYQRALRRHGDALLGRGEPRGNLALREQLAEHLRAHRGLSIGPENVLVTRGMAMARTLIATGLLSKGAQVAVEDPGQPEAWEAFRSAAGAVLHPIPVDAGGLDVDALGRLASRQSLDALLVSPRRQDPTTIPLEPERRAQLLDLARQHGFAVLEEDPNAEIFYSEGPALPLAAMDGGGSVLHMGSLAATLAPGLGLGFIVAPRALVDRLARARQRLDDQGDRVLEWALADLLRDGDYSRHLARVRQVYAQRLSDLLEALPVELGAGFQARRPEGGLACWLESPGVDIEAWCRRAQAAGVRILPGSRHALMPRPIEALRLGFGALEPGEMRRALRVLREALPKGAPR